jgi:hypothetical protein
MPEDIVLRSDPKETTWVIEPDTLEMYTTDRRLWLRAITRNPCFIKAVDLRPGYLVVWPISEAKSLDSLVRPKPGGDQVVQRFLTEAEVAARQKSADRIRSVRASRGLQ